MSWYKVIKTIRGRQYLYWQRTQRVGRKVKTYNKYIGPAHGSLVASTGELWIPKMDGSGELKYVPSQPDLSEQQKGYEELAAVMNWDEKTDDATERRVTSAAVYEIGGMGGELLGSPAVASPSHYTPKPSTPLGKAAERNRKLLTHAFTLEEEGRAEREAKRKEEEENIRRRLANDNAFAAATLSKKHRREDERIQYGSAKVRKTRLNALIRAAKRNARGKKFVNPFLGQAKKK